MAPRLSLLRWRTSTSVLWLGALVALGAISTTAVLPTSTLPSLTTDNFSACETEHVVARRAALQTSQLLGKLGNRRFFRYFKADLLTQCPHWMAFSYCDQGCHVLECDDAEVPQCWEELDQNQRGRLSFAPSTSSADSETAKITNSATGNTAPKSLQDSVLETEQEWTDEESGWTLPTESWKMSYFDLVEFPETNTGYGAPAVRVWDAIYSHNCIMNAQRSDSGRNIDNISSDSGASEDGLVRDGTRGSVVDSSQQCLEERVFYRIISGLHASINTHIYRFYEYNSFSETWNPTPESIDKFASSLLEHPERLQNIDFALLFVLRAIRRSGDQLRAHPFYTGDSADDAKTARLVRELLDTPLLCDTGEVIFDESALFAGSTSATQQQELKTELRETFRNISSLMNCVTCSKCRVWGKLQTTALGAAFNILVDGRDSSVPQLERNEIIALIVTAKQLATSILAAEELTDAAQQMGIAPSASPAAAAAAPSATPVAPPR